MSKQEIININKKLYIGIGQDKDIDILEIMKSYIEYLKNDCNKKYDDLQSDYKDLSKQYDELNEENINCENNQKILHQKLEKKLKDYEEKINSMNKVLQQLTQSQINFNNITDITPEIEKLTNELKNNILVIQKFRAELEKLN